MNVRLVAATHRNLLEMTESRELLSDHYNALTVIPISATSMRARREDIPLLVEHFVELSSRRTGRQIDSIPQETMDALQSYHWPGNIRELQNLIERAVILSDDGVLPNPLPAPAIRDLSISRPPSTLKESERDLILQALEDHGWMVGGAKGAAAKLGVKRTTLISKMQKLGLSRPLAN